MQIRTKRKPDGYVEIGSIVKGKVRVPKDYYRTFRHHCLKEINRNYPACDYSEKVKRGLIDDACLDFFLDVYQTTDGRPEHEAASSIQALFGATYD